MGIFKIKRFTKDSSEEKKIDDDNEKLSTKDKWIKRGTYAGGVAAGMGAGKLSGLIGKKQKEELFDDLINRGFFKDSNSDEDKRLIEGLKDKTKDKVHVIEHPLMGIPYKGKKIYNSYYNLMPWIANQKLADKKEAEKAINQIKKEFPNGLPKEPKPSMIWKNPEEYDKLMKKWRRFNELTGKLGPYVDLGTKRADVLAHELGHMEIQQNPFNGDQSKLKAAAEKLSQSYVAGLARGLVANPLTAAVNSTKNGWVVDEDDDNKIKFNKKSLILPAISAGLVLSQPLYEHGASRRGLRMLKELGASNKYLKEAEEGLIGKKSALSSYKIAAAQNMVGNLAGYGSGLAIGKIRAEKLKDKKDDKGNYIIKRK